MKIRSVTDWTRVWVGYKYGEDGSRDLTGFGWKKRTLRTLPQHVLNQRTGALKELRCMDGRHISRAKTEQKMVLSAKNQPSHRTTSTVRGSALYAQWARQVKAGETKLTLSDLVQPMAEEFFFQAFSMSIKVGYSFVRMFIVCNCIFKR